MTTTRSARRKQRFDDVQLRSRRQNLAGRDLEVFAHRGVDLCTDFFGGTRMQQTQRQLVDALGKQIVAAGNPHELGEPLTTHRLSLAQGLHLTLDQ